MDGWLENFAVDGLMNLSSRQLLDFAVRHFYVFVLALIRLSGLMTTGPIFGQAVVPFRARVLLIGSVALFLSPVLHQGMGSRLVRFDANQDGRLSDSEVPPYLHGRVAQIAASKELDPSAGVPLSEFPNRVTVPAATSDLVAQVITEYGVGFLLGLGAMFVLSGLQLAGQLVDQQIGIEFGSVVNPDLGAASLSSQAFFLLGGVALLLMEPVGGHLLMLQSLIETFDSLPVGEAAVFSDVPLLLTHLVHQSLVLAVQVAAPMLAVMSLVSLTMGYLGHSVPQFNQLVIGFPIRAVIGVMILLVTFTGVTHTVIDAVPQAILEMQIALTSPP